MAFVGKSAVIIGAVGEIIELANVVHGGRRERRLKVGSAVILTLGLLFEYWGDGRLARISDLHLESVIREAGHLRLTGLHRNREASHERLRAAKLERETLELRMARLPRDDLFDSDRFLGELKGKPTGTVKILYQPYDHEAWSLAGRIGFLLKESPPEGAGWNVPSDPAPIPTEPKSSGEPAFAKAYPNEPPAIRYGAWFGLSLFARSMPQPGRELIENLTARGALVWALSAGLGGVTQLADPSLPDDSTFVIIVGPKP